MLTFANRFDEGVVGVIDDDMDGKRMPSDITTGAKVGKEDMGSPASSIEPKVTDDTCRTISNNLTRG